MGVYSSKGFLSYYLVAILVKTPIPFLILSGFGAVTALAQKQWTRLKLLGVPIVIMLAVDSLSAKQTGLRYFLASYPFLFILAGLGAMTLWQQKRKGIALLCLLLIWNTRACLAIGPDYLTYFNELVGGASNGYKIMVDSNLDWGQTSWIGKLCKKERQS